MSEEPVDHHTDEPPESLEAGHDDAMEQLAAGMAALHQRGRNGANWFFWVAGLSLVNSAVILLGGNTHFVIGLGVTLFVDAMATGVAQQQPENAMMAKGIALVVDLFIAAIVVLFGWLAGRRYLALYLTGMGLYLLDALIYVLIQEWMSVAFHAYALFCMWGGLSAFRQLGQIEAALATNPVAANDATPFVDAN